MKKPPVIQYHRKSLFLNYNVFYDRWYAERVKHDYHAYVCDFFRFGFEPKLFYLDNIYYDGNTYKGLVFLGIAIGYGHAIDIEQVIE